MASSVSHIRASTAAPPRLRRPGPGRVARWGALVALFAALGFAGWVWQVRASTAGAIYALDDARLPARHTALVFGAGLTATGGPSPILYDRVATAVDLYRAGKVAKLLMTGDNGSVEYNEVAAMLRTAVDLGVPERDIVLDYAGFRTYDSCYRARAVFGLREATLVTNAFHLPRALYTCAALGVQGAGVISDRRPYSTTQNALRELPALAVTRWWLLVDRQPRFLGPRVDIDAPQER
jgi:vancomycin permeability regulator SanA